MRVPHESVLLLAAVWARTHSKSHSLRLHQTIEYNLMMMLMMVMMMMMMMMMVFGGGWKVFQDAAG